MNVSLDALLTRLCRRQRMRTAVRCAGYGLLAGSVTAAGVALIGLLAGAAWMASAWWAPLAGVAGFAVIGAIVGAVLPIDRLAAARALDRAASAQDRFASAVELVDHPRQRRAHLIVEDALRCVERTTPRAALPLQLPPGLRWTTLALVALAVVLVIGPGETLEATPPPPELTSEQWQEVRDAFDRSLEQLPEPRTETQHEVKARLHELADLLDREPTLRDILAEMAAVRSEVTERNKANPARELSMRQAGRSLRTSRSLEDLGSLLRRGEYDEAARELERVAQRMEAGELAMDASEFERAAGDLESMAEALKASPDLQQACRECAGAAGSMNRKRLADAMRRFADRLNQSTDDLEDADSCRQANRMLDDLARDLNRQSCKDGSCRKAGQCSSGSGRFVRDGSGKGGLDAGWGSAERWQGGTMSPDAGMRVPDLVSVQEGAGRNTAYTAVSSDEDAEAAQVLEDMYVDLVRKAEADLELESVPVAYREYLRRYFRAIRPDAGEENADEEGRR